MLLALFSSSILLIVAAAALDVSLRWEWLPAMLVVTVLAQSAMFFILYVVALKIHQMDAYNAVVGVMYVLMMFLSSMFYPLSPLPGWFQAVLSLRDSQDREVAFADDFRFDPDPVLFVKIPATGEYEIEIHDSIFRGREDFVYRIAISEQPFAKSIFPLGGREGAWAYARVRCAAT